MNRFCVFWTKPTTILSFPTKPPRDAECWAAIYKTHGNKFDVGYSVSKGKEKKERKKERFAMKE
jgi:hypothetical protein